MDEFFEAGQSTREIVTRGTRVIVLQMPGAHHIAVRGLAGKAYAEDYLETNAKVEIEASAQLSTPASAEPS